MFTSINLPEAEATNWDVIIAGSSFSAMFFLKGLPRDLRVLIVEKGDIVPWDVQLRDNARPQEEFRGTGTPKAWVAHTLFGGNSNCWWGQTPRFHPSDFEVASRYGIAADWPIGYDALEPFYADVEQVMQIAGGGSDQILPRSTPFPFPPHQLSRTDIELVRHAPGNWVPVPSARANGGDRATCCANGMCDMCPIEAKFSVLNSIERFDRPGVHLLTGAEARAVEAEGGRARRLLVRTGGRELTLRGERIALATNGIFNAAILLRSGIGGDLTGRYLHEQHSVYFGLDVDQKNYFGGSTITSHGYGAYDGEHRKTAAAVLIENYNAPYLLRPVQGRWTERMQIKMIAEDLPHPDNRVRLDKEGDVVIDWHGHSDYAHRGIDRAEAMLQEMMPFKIENIVTRQTAETEAHIQGTHRMGSDPATSVTNDLMQVHGTPGLYALGSGAFPSCSPANPTLTLSALALRAGRGVS